MSGTFLDGFAAHRELTIRRLAALENKILSLGQPLISWSDAFLLVEQAIDDIRAMRPDDEA